MRNGLEAEPEFLKQCSSDVGQKEQIRCYELFPKVEYDKSFNIINSLGHVFEIVYQRDKDIMHIYASKAPIFLAFVLPTCLRNDIILSKGHPLNIF